jgi:hypothetical protein
MAMVEHTGRQDGPLAAQQSTAGDLRVPAQLLRPELLCGNRRTTSMHTRKGRASRLRVINKGGVILTP